MVCWNSNASSIGQSLLSDREDLQGEENCISVSATAQVESSPQSNWWSAKVFTM
jgi:hypothetical protein